MTSVGVLYYAAIVPCVLSAIIGLWVAQLCGVPPTAFSLQGVPNLTPVTLLQCIGMGVLFALLSILFCRMMHAAPRLYDKYLPNPVARAAAGGALVIALTFLVWLWNPAAPPPPCWGYTPPLERGWAWCASSAASPTAP